MNPLLSDREESFRLLVETMNEGLGVRDVNGLTTYVNRRLCEMLGYRREELLGRHLSELVDPQEWQRFERELASRDQGQSSSYELTLVRKDGRPVPTLQSGRPLFDQAGKLIGSFAVITDLSRIKQAEHRLRLTQFTVDRAVEATFWLDQRGVFLYANDSAVELTGIARERLVEMSVHDLSPDLAPEAYAQIWERARHGSLRHEDGIQRADGRVIPVEVTINHLDYQGHEVLIAVARDVSDRKQAEAKLLHDALHDSLTGLPNRTLFMDRLQHCLERSQRIGAPFAVLFLDIDRFKLINDSLGHVAGDRLLVLIAERLRAGLRLPDTVARVGGDEFLVLLEDTGAAEAREVAERLCIAFREPFRVDGRDLFSTLSIGIGIQEQERYRTAEEVVRDADIAMYQAKARGGASTALFDGRMHRLSLSRLELETDLRQGLADQRFELRYQPVVAAGSGRPVWLEALLRWRHPQRGLVGPEEIISVAEECGLIAPITWWVIEEACRFMQRLDEQVGGEPLTLSVNLSGRLMDRPELVMRVRSALETCGLAPSRLVLEVTESAVLERSHASAEVLRELVALGIEVVIDDFGAGHSSLQYLCDLPVETVKIDRTLVAGLEEGSRRREILRSVITLMHNLEMQVVAEGVESQAQLDLLRSMGCDLLQGFLFARPLTGREITDWLHGHGDGTP